MDWMYLFYFALALLMFFGAKSMGRGSWNEEFTSLKQTKILQGITALGIVLHHMAQKTCGSWHPPVYTVHGLDFFVSIGYLLVAVFLFCSGMGLYKSLHTKPDYLKSFFRRRIIPVMIAYYLSEWIHMAVRLLMGQKMNLTEILWYLSGLHMANPDAWYMVAITFFFLVFWAAFRFCKREGVAIFCIFAFTLAYTVLGAYIGHQDDWWIQGEWWYNSILLFPVGILFARYEKPVTRFFRKGYWFWLLLSFAGLLLLFRQSEWLNNNAWGYYDALASRMRVQHSLLSAGGQWLVCLFYVVFCFLVMMKVKLGNKVLAWLGGITLELYLMHDIFVELFGYSFLDITKSLVYIKKVPLYVLAVLGSSVPAALLFRWILRKITDPLKRNKKKLTEEEKKRRLHVRDQKEKTRKVFRTAKKWIFCILLLAVTLIMIFGFPKDNACTVGGLRVTPPEGFVKTSADSRQTIWKYSRNDIKPGVLILDEGIQGKNAQYFASAEEVLQECDWLTEAELYVNPQGIRMARGFSITAAGYRERRYYVECDQRMFLLCMIEDDRFYDPADCEKAMLLTADAVRRK